MPRRRLLRVHEDLDVHEGRAVNEQGGEPCKLTGVLGEPAPPHCAAVECR